MIKRLRKYQNKLDLHHKSDPKSNRENFVMQAVRDSTSLPKTLNYEDIDAAFKAWVEEKLYIDFEGEKVPTYSLMSLQRFSEYMQTWKTVDNNNNLLMNFKVITREVNPKPGTLYGDSKNIPGEQLFLMRRVLVSDKNGRPYFIEYRRKQPTCVDLFYSVNIISNKLELVNQFNLLVNTRFNSIQDYIFPNGYAIPMVLDDISDESEFNLDERQFFSQSFSIKLRAYTVQESDFVVEEVPMPKVMFMGDCKDNKAIVEIEEFECGESPYYYQPIKLTVNFEPNENSVKFRINTNIAIDEIQSINMRQSFRVRVNDTDVDQKFSAKDGDEILIFNAKKINIRESGKIVFIGHNPDVIYDEREDNQEIESDDKQKDIEIEIDATNE